MPGSETNILRMPASCGDQFPLPPSEASFAIDHTNPSSALEIYVFRCMIDVITSHTPEEGAHILSWPNRLIIISIII
jgi:hypothetical protein